MEYWGASTNPKWPQLDLETPRPIPVVPRCRRQGSLSLFLFLAHPLALQDNAQDTHTCWLSTPNPFRVTAYLCQLIGGILTFICRVPIRSVSQDLLLTHSLSTTRFSFIIPSSGFPFVLKSCFWNIFDWCFSHIAHFESFRTFL